MEEPPLVLITDRDLNVVGDPIGHIQSLEVQQKFNEPDSGVFTVPAYPDYMSVFSPGNRVVVIVDGEIFSSGPIEKPGGFEWSVKDNGERGVGNVSVNFAGDLSYIARRLTYPNPGQDAGSQTVAYYEDSGNAEDIIRDLVNLNAGPGAFGYRRIGPLVLGADAGVGTDVVVKTRFEPVTEVARNLALIGGGLGIRCVQVGTDLVFSVFQPADRTGVARFSRGLGNLRSIKYDIAAPSGTQAIVGGDGEAEVRTIIERTSYGEEADWGRSEFWVAASNSDEGTGGLEQSGDEALADHAQQTSLSTIIIDTPIVKFGRDYKMGDKVTIEVFPGIEVVNTVRSATYKYSPAEGANIDVLVGNQEATRDPEWVRLTQRLSSRLGRIERS